MFHVILFNPQIPPNTGNIIRLCANTGASLHLVHPLGFTLDAKSCRRAGLDYHDLASVLQHDSLDACLAGLQPQRLFAVTKFAAQRYDSRVTPAAMPSCSGPRQPACRPTFTPALPMRRRSVFR
jgi:tRNA (cytidine/uridine-2'-O-)-methyltransferase